MTVSADAAGQGGRRERWKTKLIALASASATTVRFSEKK